LRKKNLQSIKSRLKSFWAYKHEDLFLKKEKKEKKKSKVES